VNVDMKLNSENMQLGNFECFVMGMSIWAFLSQH